MRKQITTEQVDKGINTIKEWLDYRLVQKGYGTFASSHEILGVVMEEFDELIGAVQSNNLVSVREELIDIAIGCIFGVICIDSNTID